MQYSRLLAALTVVFAVRAAAQDAPPPPPMNDAMMKYIEASSPNEHHKKLAPFLGAWDAASSFWMDGPDKPPATSVGVAKIMWALDGRFLRQEFKGWFMGMPMNGLGFTGYDNLKKLYTFFWVDNTSTGMATATGTLDEAGTTLTMTGNYDDPVTGEMGKSVKYVIRLTAPDRYTFEIFDVPKKGPEIRTGEVVYTKSKELR